MPDERPLSEVVRLLREEVLRRAGRHPAGHLLHGRGGEIGLELRVPLGGDPDAADTAVASLDRELERGLSILVAQRSVFRPGHCYCLRCRSAECAHSTPRESRHVFAGYGPSGIPRFSDFGQWLLESGDLRVDALYGDGSPLVAQWSPGQDLTRDLLPAFRDSETGFRLHGQVVAGWYRVPSDGGRPDAFALTFQVVSSGPRRGRRRFGINVVGTAPGGESLERVHLRLGTLPWSAAVRWGQAVLEEIERQQGGRRRPGRALDRRLEGLLSGLARRLERQRRASERRTRHADRRHEEGTRPTRMAVADLERAEPGEVLFDGKNRTFVVLGERGRTHFFSEAGKLVTSVRYPPAAIDKRRRAGRWKPASPEQVAALKGRLQSGAADSPLPSAPDS